MESIPDPGEVTELVQPSFDEFQRQASLMTSCTLLWKELSDHINSLEQNLLKQSETLKRKIETLDSETKASLESLKKRELSIEDSVKIALRRVDFNTKAAMRTLSDELEENPDGEVDNGDCLLQHLKSSCLKMEAKEFWNFVTGKKKELDLLREKIPAALSECIDPVRFVMEVISEVFPVDKRGNEGGSDLGWACVLILESLIPVLVDPVIGKSRMLVTPSMKEQAKEIAVTWKKSLEERGGIENVKTPDVHTFLQHLVTFGIVKKEDLEFYRKLVVASAWRKQMPKLAVSLGLGDQMPDMIEELISKGQQLDAVHFTYEVGLVDKFPPAPLLKAFLRDAKKAASSILDDPNNTGRAVQLAARKEQSALRAVIKCIEEYKLEAEFPPENLKKRLEQLEKSKTEKRKPVVVPANKRTRASNGGPMPPAKAGRLTNAYVSSFHAPPPFVRSPSHTQYPTPVQGYPSPPAMHTQYPTPVQGYPSPPAMHTQYPTPVQGYPSPPAMYGSRSPPANPYAYSPEAAPPPLAGPYPGAPMNYPVYGGYGNGLAPAYQQAYYR
ncbi:FRIGIDA-like protein 4a [Hibiscus syriacus]|uniref:FRIGIDA-like protein n=1 Tax=Hibiscus syriacus TaxID=106335 RepID=A0A6A2XIS0_HIBSY|nr:FRIGIDA-like protein 4a [Hibiscus syriacus]KAE8658359.1 FRIGIDA-like protein 4a [Hibiscus syriacus]